MHIKDFAFRRSSLCVELLDCQPVSRKQWQSLEVASSPLHQTRELSDVRMDFRGLDVPPGLIAEWVQPDLPWAEDHFLERVGGHPINPGEAEAYWPYHGNAAQLHKRDKIYDHNYMERMWCRGLPGFSGYRFQPGDLGSVIELINKEPDTRRAFLPIWFPEDTGAISNQRVPCSLGYLFQLNAKTGHLDCWYFLRSCEMYRHFTNDVYLAIRLLQWVCNQTNQEAGTLHMTIANLHSFVGDDARLEEMIILG